jgi:hypothetical protein
MRAANRRRSQVDAGADALRAMVDDVRRRPLTHEETRAVADLLQTIRRLLDDDL